MIYHSFYGAVHGHEGLEKFHPAWMALAEVAIDGADSVDKSLNLVCAMGVFLAG